MAENKELALVNVQTNNDGAPVINGRELHEFLQVSTPFGKWMPRMIEYGFSENTDFWTEDKNVLRADGTAMPQTTKEYTLSIDMAKEISMLQRNERGKLARQHFIAIEKQWNSPEAVMARALMMANRSIEALKSQTLQLETQVKEKDEKIAALQPQADYVEDVMKTTGGALTITHLVDLYSEKGELSARAVYRMLEADRAISGKEHRPCKRYIDAGIFTYQIPEYGSGFQGFRSHKLALRLTQKGFALMAEHYIPRCIECCRAYAEYMNAQKALQKAQKKPLKNELKQWKRLKEAEEEARDACAMMDAANVARSEAFDEMAELAMAS